MVLFVCTLINVNVGGGIRRRFVGGCLRIWLLFHVNVSAAFLATSLKLKVHAETELCRVGNCRFSSSVGDEAEISVEFSQHL